MSVGLSVCVSVCRSIYLSTAQPTIATYWGRGKRREKGRKEGRGRLFCYEVEEENDMEAAREEEEKRREIERQIKSFLATS